MGQKVNPHGARVGVIMDWSTKWYADKKNFADNLIEDNELRVWLKKKLYAAGISHIDIARAGTRLDISIWAAKTGIIMGTDGKAITALKEELIKKTGNSNINIQPLEVRNPECDATLVAEDIAQQIEKRISFRRAMKQAISRAQKAGAKGIKTAVSGRLGGADIARSEGYHEGSIPLQTLRANIDYGFAEAHTTYGRIGVKVWIYKGEHLGKGYAPRSLEGRANDRRDRRDRGERRPYNRENRAPRGQQAPRAQEQPNEGGK